MRHTDGDPVHIIICRLVDDRIQQRNERLSAFERETLLTQVFGLQEGLKGLGLNKLLQNMHQTFAARLAVAMLQLLLEPFTGFTVFHVHVLHSESTRICLTQTRQNSTQRKLFFVAKPSRRPYSIQIPQSQTVAFYIQIGV